MAKFIPPDKLPYDLTMVDRVKFAEMLAHRDGPTVDRRTRIGQALLNPEFVRQMYQLYEIRPASLAQSRSRLSEVIHRHSGTDGDGGSN